MSFLTPLYILGALAIAAPVVFHLIRRSPRGEVPFSSLMFLAPTPPRLTRRSRLDNLWLLLLRAAALGLLAFAFARPFLRQAARLDFGDVERQRVAVLIDTSASMRRGDLWPRAKTLAEQAIAECRPGDQVAVFAFDGSTRPLLGFEEAAALDPARRQAVAQARLDRTAPTWASTRLDQALIDAIGAIEGVADASEKAGRMPRRIVLISDLQQGSRLDALGDFEWPSDVGLELKTVAENRSNAGLQWLADSPEAEPADAKQGLRVRVANDAGSRQESFQLRWVDGQGNGTGKPAAVYVPPGESRAVSVPRPADGTTQPTLRLEGDQEGFDNVLYTAAETRSDSTVLYVGRDQADDAAGLLYYLRRVFTDTARSSVRVEAVPPPALAQLDRSVRLVVLSTETTPENTQRLKAYVDGGGTLLYVLGAPGPVTTLAALASCPLKEVDEGEGPRDALLGEIAFDHPLFAPFSNAQFNDFTKIRFWKHRRLPADALGDARILARFENGDPALVEKVVGKGRVYVLTSGWNPSDSQLARSSKFVPLLAGLLEPGISAPLASAHYHVLDRVPLPGGDGAAKELVVHKPDGAVVRLKAGSTVFAETDQPGVYTVEGLAGALSFAVNLDPAESKTAPLHAETLEQFGCRLASPSRSQRDPAHLRQMHNAELEGRQKLWRWLILAAVFVLIVETWLAGRVRQPRAEALAT
ncbi:MAG: BatA domain-containing protein [Isosphaeraceae bacterium]|nr:BatA domain-containing protein [Isosphaeraceae bacterium]